MFYSSKLLDGALLLSSGAELISRRPPHAREQARVAEAAGAVGLVVINNEPGGVTLTMPGASNAGVYDDDEEEEQGGGGVQGSGVNIPVAMVRADREGLVS